METTVEEFMSIVFYLFNWESTSFSFF
jgi:hypothetical protein